MSANRFTAQALTLAPFDPADPVNVMAERERRAAHDFHVRRLNRAGRHKDSDTVSILLGGAVALAGFLQASMVPGQDLQDVQERFEAIMQFAWVQALGIADNACGFAPGSERVQ